jgi:electron transfer flavoprotein alpha subunit
MKALVWIEHEGGRIKDASLSAITAASKLGEVHLLVAGHEVGNVALAAADIPGTGTVYVADAPAHAHAAPEALAPLIVDLMSGHDAFLAPTTANGKNIAPRVAALMDVMQVSDILSVEDERTFTRSIYAGTAITTVRTRDAKLVITVRAAAFETTRREGGARRIEAVLAAAGADGVNFVGAEASASHRPDLGSARVVVAGGRALQSGEKFHALLGPLADKLGAALGASRAAVDANWLPNNYQIGQTGKVVAPEVYIAVGISGAIQHLAGMKDSKTIVAINKDPEAPIFQFADIGLVADIFEAIPELTARL